MLTTTLHLQPYKIYWMPFLDYYKHCDKLAMSGACYSFVFNDTMPTDYQQPYEFEQCVYVGKSSNNYYDVQNKTKGKVRSMVHKRMTNHHQPFATGQNAESSHQSIIDVYGYGEDIISGKNTNLPMWLCLLIPRPDVPVEAIPRWCLTQEQMQLFQYENRWGHCTLGNMDTKGRKNKDSMSSLRMESIREQSLEGFML